MTKITNEFTQKISNANYERLVGIAENILLLPNDNKLLLGEERFNQMKNALEDKLNEDYKEDDLYKYYYGLNKVSHGFCNFKRWKSGLLF